MKTFNSLLLLILFFLTHKELQAQNNIHENFFEAYIAPVEKFENQLKSNLGPKRIALFNKSASDTTIYLLDSLFYSFYTDEKKIIITYNDDLHEVIQLKQSLDSSSLMWINEDEISKLYDIEGNLLSVTKKLWNLDSDQFNNNTRYEFDYDKNGRLVLEKFLYWDSEQRIWVYADSRKYNFDLRGYLVEILSQSWNDKLNEWVNQFRVKSANNSMGNQTKYLHESWEVSSNEWQPLFNYEYSYDLWGNRTSTLFQGKNYENMELYNLYFLQSNYINRKIVSSSIVYWNPTGEIDRKMRLEYSYFENGEQNLILGQTFDFISQSWVNDFKTSFSFGVDNSQIELFESWNSGMMAWEKRSRWIRLFDQNNNILNERSEIWNKDNKSWEKERRNIQEFDSNNNLIYKSFETWNGSYWESSPYVIRLTSDATEIELTGSNLRAYYSPFTKTITSLHLDEPDFILSQNYPNPFNPITIITFKIPNLQYVTIDIYNSLGEQISTLVDGLRAEGTYKEIFNAENLSSGVYFYQISAGSFNQVKKMLLLK